MKKIYQANFFFTFIKVFVNWQKLVMPYFYFSKTSDVGLMVFFTNEPEKSGLDETATE